MSLNDALSFAISCLLWGIALLVILTATLVFASPVNAQDHRHRLPPNEAYVACESQVEADGCSVETRHGVLNGQCAPAGGRGLACLPKTAAASMIGDGECCNPRRNHMVLQSTSGLKLLAADQSPIAEGAVDSVVYDRWRIIQSNGIASHDTGRFPNRGNPNAIAEQNIAVRVPAFPALTTQIIPVKVLGWAINGVPFDPGTAETYNGLRDTMWHYEAMSGAVDLGLDQNHAHVQPGGQYHYHGLPTGLLRELELSSDMHSPLVGWAVDGFPIYAVYAFSEHLDPGSEVVEMTSSYRLKEGKRPGGGEAPGGYYDGTFTGDYEYVAGAGTLDQCNGRFAVTPEFPAGTYAYFLTDSWPVVPRCVRGQLEPQTAQLERQSARARMRQSDTKEGFHPGRH